MTCRAWQHLLQQHLDGPGGAGAAGALEEHLGGCPDCVAQQAAVARFLTGLALLRPAAPPADLCDRLTRRACAEVVRGRTRQRRVLAFTALAAAAAVLVALGVRWGGPGGGAGERPPAPRVAARQPEERVRPLRDELADAGNAVAALTAREVGKTREQTRSLLPVLTAPAFEPLAAVPAPVEPLRDASSNVSGNLAPVTESFGRAVGLFFRDLPMGKGAAPAAAPKPG
jgi:hypothetical protein